MGRHFVNFTLLLLSNDKNRGIVISDGALGPIRDREPSPVFCKDAAESMTDYLKKNNQHGSIITITYTNSIGYIWSDIAGATISQNGVHVGVEYNGIVYCNVHPFGLPETLWVNDFYATGEKIVTKIPF